MSTGKKHHYHKDDDQIQNESFRQNVAGVIRNSRGEILIAARLDYPESWQFPQGGVDKGETEEEAVMREVSEEIGIYSISIIKKSDFLHRYHFEGKSHFSKVVGQSQRYFLIEFYGTDDEISLNNGKHHEFCSWKWINPLDLPLDHVYKPRQTIYQKVIKEFFDLDLPQTK